MSFKLIGNGFTHRDQNLRALVEFGTCKIFIVHSFLGADADGRLVHTSNANANASASSSKHTCELPQRKRKRKRKRQRKKWKISHFLALAFALAFAFHTCEPGQHKRKHKMNNTGSMPLWFKFKPRWRPRAMKN